MLYASHYPFIEKVHNFNFFSVLGCDSFERVLDIFKESKMKLGEILSAFEFLDADAIAVARDNLKLSIPIDDSFPFYVLIESSGSDGTHDEEKMNGFLEDMMNRGYVIDGTVASEPAKIQVCIQ